MNELTDEQKRVLLDRGTETPFTGEHLSEKRDGMFVCAQCDAELFSSNNKYESGSGWPAFDDVVRDTSILLTEDLSHGMKRVSVECAKCDGHLGHYFSDGMSQSEKPQYCINSVSLDFKPK